MKKRKRSKLMSDWLRWLRLNGACQPGVEFVRQFSSPQKAWEAMGKAGQCSWMVWLATTVDLRTPIEHTYRNGDDGSRCAASILRRYPKVPDWRGK